MSSVGNQIGEENSADGGQEKGLTVFSSAGCTLTNSVKCLMKILSLGDLTSSRVGKEGGVRKQNCLFQVPVNLGKNRKRMTKCIWQRTTKRAMSG